MYICQFIKSYIHLVKQVNYLNWLALRAHIGKSNYVAEQNGHCRKFSFDEIQKKNKNINFTAPLSC